MNFNLVFILQIKNKKNIECLNYKKNNLKINRKLKELEKENENLKLTFNSTFNFQSKDEGFTISSPLKNSNKLKKSKSNFGMNKSHTSKK